MKRCLTMLLLLVALGWLAIAYLDKVPSPGGITYDEALAATEARMAVLDRTPPVSEEVVLSRFGSLWSDLTVERVDLLFDQVYAADVWFNDTVKTITGGDALRHYLQETAGRVESCRVEITDVAGAGGNYYVRWRMTVVPAGSATEQAWISAGMTHLRFGGDGRVILHQDYWDAASGLFEHFPGIGWILRNIKARL